VSYVSLGIYPTVSLATARRAAVYVKEALRDGRDPREAAKMLRRTPPAKRVIAYAGTDQAAGPGTDVDNGTSFRMAAADWLAHKTHWAPGRREALERQFEKDVYPKIGARDIALVRAPQLAEVVEAVLKRGAPTVAAAIQRQLSGIFERAVAKGLCLDNPARPLKVLLPKSHITHHLPGLTDPVAIGDFLRRARKILGDNLHMQHRLLASTAVRIHLVGVAEWAEFHLDDPVPTWVIPRRKMKTRSGQQALRGDFVVFLGPTIVRELKAWRVNHGGRRYLFLEGDTVRPYAHNRNDPLEGAYRETLGMAGKHTPHGWRTSLSTLLREEAADLHLPTPQLLDAAIELTLDHGDENKVRGTYNRAQLHADRARIAVWWDARLAAMERLVPPARSESSAKSRRPS